MKKDTSKCKEWERRRRDRLNDAFKALAQLLPHYDPAKVPPKIDILEKSTQFVKELRLSNSRLLTTQTQPTEMSSKIKELQDEVNKLILRVKQLTVLLTQAKIPIPSGPSIKLLGKRRLKWTNRLCPDNLENVNGLKSHVPQEAVQNQALPDAEPTDSKISRLENYGNETGTNQSQKTKIIVISTPNATKEGGSGPLKETNPTVETPVLTKEVPAQAAAEPVLEPTTATPPVSTLPTLILTQCPQPLVMTLNRPQQRILPKFTLVNSLFQLPKIPIMPIRKPLPPKPKLVRRRRPKQMPKTLATCQTQTVEEKAINSPIKTADANEIISGHKDAETLAQTEINKTNRDVVASPLPQLIDITEDEAESTAQNSANVNELPLITDIAVGQADTENSKNVPEVIGDSLAEIEIGILTKPSQASDKISELREIDESTIVEKPDDLIPALEEIRTNPKSVESEPKAMESAQGTETSEIANVIAAAPVATATAVPAPTVELLIHDISPKPIIPMPIPSDSVKQRDILEEACLSSDKISECIARSMDLIEHPENELMELGSDWGTHSPKSPISPTQMFLSMFPLLPRESIVTVAAETSQQHKSSSRSSFYIDSMLPEPEDQPSHSASIHNLESENHFRNLTSVSTTCLAMTPLVPIHTCTKNSKNDLNFTSSLDSFNKVLAPLQNFKEKRNTPAVYASLNDATSTRSVGTANPSTDSRNTVKPSSAKKFLTLLEPVSTNTASTHENQHPNFFPYTPITGIEAQSHSMSQFFNTFSNSGSTTAPYTQSHAYVPVASVQTPCSTVSSTNRQTDFDFSFRQNYYQNQEVSAPANPLPNQQQQQHRIETQNTAPVRQSTTSKEPTTFSQGQTQKSNSSQKAQSELFRPAPNVFLGNTMNQNNAGSPKQQPHKASRDTQAYRTSTGVQRACHTKNSNANSNPAPPPPSTASTITPACVRHQNMSYSQAPLYQLPTQTQPTGPGHGQKQVPSFQTQPRNQLPLPPPSMIPSFPAAASQKQAGSMDLASENNPASRPSIPTSIPAPAPDFSYSNQTYHSADTHYFHDPNSRPFYQAYSNTPVVNKSSRAAPYYLPDPVPAPYDTTHTSYPPQNSSVQPAPNTQSQSQTSHFPQNSNFFPPFYNNPAHPVTKDCSSQSQMQVQQNQAYNTVPPKSSSQEYFQYPSNIMSNAAMSNQHHRAAPTIPTATPSPKKTPAMNFAAGPQQVSNPGMKRSNNSTVQQQRPVNWMTDNSTYKKGTGVASNPFSVSKLVGTHPGNNPSTNYCAEALIRKNSNNSSWNDFQFGSNPNPPVPIPPAAPENSPQFHGTQPFLSQSSQQTGQYTPQNFPHQHQYQHHQHHNPYSRNFNQFDNSQQHHQNPGGTSSNVQQASSSSVNTPGTTTSISNFNLSSIFPEINDKGSKGTSGNNANNCNYYVNRK